MGSLTIVTDSGNATSVDGVIYMLGEGTISTVGGNNTVEIYGTTFLSLPDTPDTYEGYGNYTLRVNETETGLEWVVMPVGGNGTADSFKFISVDGVMLEASGISTLTLTGTDIEYTGDPATNTIDLAIGGERVEEIGNQLGNINDYVKIGYILGLPLLLGLIGAVRHSLTGYLCGVVGFALAIPLLDDTFGLAIVVPAALLILGLMGSGIKDALGDGLNIV